MLINDLLLDALASEAQASPRLRMNRDMRNTPDDGSQRMLNALEPGTVLPVHRHRGTSECQILLRGKIDVMFYDDAGRETARFRLDRDEGRYGVNVPAGTWHNLTVIEPAVMTYWRQRDEDLCRRRSRSVGSIGLRGGSYCRRASSARGRFYTT